MKGSDKISVVIPVFNGSDSLNELTERISTLPLNGTATEIIMVFDHGREEAWYRIEELSRLYPGVVHGYRLERNYGQQRALLYGISQSNGHYIVTMDEDLQHDPDYIPALIAMAEEGNHEVVYGRFRELQQPPVRKFFSGVLRKVLVTFRPSLPRDYSPYRIIRHDVAAMLPEMNGTIAFVDDYLSRVASRFGVEEIEHRARKGNKSSYTVSSLVMLAVSAILAYTAAIPLMLAGGVALVVLSFFTFIDGLAESVAFYGGLVLLFFGIVALISNNINTKKNRREVIVESKTGS